MNLGFPAQIRKGLHGGGFGGGGEDSGTRRGPRGRVIPHASALESPAAAAIALSIPVVEASFRALPVTAPSPSQAVAPCGSRARHPTVDLAPIAVRADREHRVAARAPHLPSGLGLFHRPVAPPKNTKVRRPQKPQNVRQSESVEATPSKTWLVHSRTRSAYSGSSLDWGTVGHWIVSLGAITIAAAQAQRDRAMAGQTTPALTSAGRQTWQGSVKFELANGTPGGSRPRTPGHE